MGTHDDHVHHNARYHVDDLHDVAYYVDANDPTRYGCTDDDCTRDHVHVIAAAEFDANYVDRPVWHDHDHHGRRRPYHHHHDGRAITHYHWPNGAVQYVASDGVFPAP